MSWNAEKHHLHASAVIFSYRLAQVLIIFFNGFKPLFTLALVTLHVVDVGCNTIKRVRVAYFINLLVVVIASRSLILFPTILAV